MIGLKVSVGNRHAATRAVTQKQVQHGSVHAAPERQMRVNDRLPASTDHHHHTPSQSHCDRDRVLIK
jgi:hypothetical protein